MAEKCPTCGIVDPIDGKCPRCGHAFFFSPGRTAGPSWFNDNAVEATTESSLGAKDPPDFYDGGEARFNCMFFAAVAFFVAWLVVVAQGGLPRRSMAITAALVSGAFTILGGVLNWNWFYQEPRVRTVVDWLGRTGARVFYVLIGSILTALGICLLAVQWHLPNTR